MNQLILEALRRLPFLPDNMDLPYFEDWQKAVNYYEKITTTHERIRFFETAVSVFESEQKDWAEDQQMVDAIQWEIGIVQEAISYLKSRPEVAGQINLLEV